MFCKKTFCAGIMILSLLMGMTACGPAQTATPAPTETAAPTETLAPTDTPQPTEVPPTQAPTAAQGTSEPGSATAGEATQPAGASATQAPANSGSAAGSSTADKYTFLGQSINDKSQLLPNRQVTITWTIQNAGTTAWSADYMMRYFSGPKPPKDTIPFGKVVAPTKTVNLTVTFTTPSDPGDYDLWFKLTNAEGKNFGDVDFVFTVSNNPQKAVPTATP